MNKLAILFFLSLVTTTAVAGNCYSEGVRVGVVQKFSNKGLMNKSWEGELVMDGFKFNSTATSNGNVWQFSALDQSVANTINDSVMNGSQVALKYCEINPLDVTRRLKVQTPYVVIMAVERKR